jgi:hypothetical protein
MDIRQLTCGHIADVPPAELDVFLAWYSGWYSGTAKKRGFNLAKVRLASQNLINFCKTNRDKRLTEVLELMLR